ncbi:MAG: hypothetical protein WBD22_01035 [Pyrinomonadaceae bacterium]
MSRINEITGGKENKDVDFVELLKKEGFFPSIDEIRKHLSAESWITESPRPNCVRITHWGVIEAKKSGNDSGDSRLLANEAKILLSETRDFVAAIEGFVSDPSTDEFAALETKLARLNALVNSLKKSL